MASLGWGPHSRPAVLVLSGLLLSDSVRGSECAELLVDLELHVTFLSLRIVFASVGIGTQQLKTWAAPLSRGGPTLHPFLPCLLLDPPGTFLTATPPY